MIRNEAGAVLAQAEDSPGTLDPVLEYTVPDKVTAITVVAWWIRKVAAARAASTG